MAMMQSSVLCVLWFAAVHSGAWSNVECDIRCQKLLTFSSWELQVFGSNREHIRQEVASHHRQDEKCQVFKVQCV